MKADLLNVSTLGRTVRCTLVLAAVLGAAAPALADADAPPRHDRSGPVEAVAGFAPATMAPGPAPEGLAAKPSSALAAWTSRHGVAPLAPAPGIAVRAAHPPVGVNFPIANYRDAATKNEDLDSPSVAFNNRRGEFMVTWHAFNRTTQTDIYAQRLSAAGAPLGGMITVCDAPGAQGVPSISYDTVFDVYWVTWTDFRNSDAPDVVIRRLSNMGTPLDTEYTVNVGANAAFASRIHCGDGRCVVTWVNDPGDGNSHILVQGFAGASIAYTPILLLSEPVGSTTEPDIYFNYEDEQFLIVWTQWKDSTGWDIWAHRMSSALASWGRFQLSNGNGAERIPRVSYNAMADRWLVVWHDGRNGTNWDIYGQLLNRDAAFVGGPLVIYPGSYHDMRPVVETSNISSQFAVAYERDITGAGQYQIYASTVGGNGSVGAAFPVRLWYNIRTRPAIVHRPGTNDFLAVFKDDGAATQSDIQAQLFQTGGALTGSLITVARGRKGQEEPSVGYMNGRDEFLTVWSDYRSGADYDLYARRVSPTGALLGGEFVLGTTSFLYGDSNIACDPATDQCLVVWQEITGPTTGYDIYGRRVANGAPQGPAFLISTGTNTFNEGKAFAVFNEATGQYLVVWHAFTSQHWRIWGQRVATTGALVGGNMIVSGSTTEAQMPRAACNPVRNECVVVWQDARNSRWDVYGQRVTGSGALSGANFPVATAVSNKGRTDIAFSNTDGGYLVVWGDERNQRDDIYAQQLDHTGALWGPEYLVAAAGAGELGPSVGYEEATEEFLVVWWAYDADLDYDLFARSVPIGTGPLEPAFTLATAPEIQSRPELAQSLRSDQLLVVFQDFRNGNYDIFGQFWSQGRDPRAIRFLRGR